MKSIKSLINQCSNYFHNPLPANHPPIHLITEFEKNYTGTESSEVFEENNSKLESGVQCQMINDAIIQIFKQLDLFNVIKCSYVSQNWNLLSKQNFIWLPFIQKYICSEYQPPKETKLHLLFKELFVDLYNPDNSCYYNLVKVTKSIELIANNPKMNYEIHFQELSSISRNGLIDISPQQHNNVMNGFYSAFKINSTTIQLIHHKEKGVLKKPERFNNPNLKLSKIYIHSNSSILLEKQNLLKKPLHMPSSL